LILFLEAGGCALWPLFVKTFDEASAGPPSETDADYLTARKTSKAGYAGRFRDKSGNGR